MMENKRKRLFVYVSNADAFDFRYIDYFNQYIMHAGITEIIMKGKSRFPMPGVEHIDITTFSYDALLRYLNDADQVFLAHNYNKAFDFGHTIELDMSKKAGNMLQVTKFLIQYLQRPVYHVLFDPIEPSNPNWRRLFLQEIDDTQQDELKLLDGSICTFNLKANRVDTTMLAHNVGYAMACHTKPKTLLGYYSKFGTRQRGKVTKLLTEISSVYEDVHLGKLQVQLHEYFLLLAKAKATLILPATYAINTISMARLHQALAHGCIPMFIEPNDLRVMPIELKAIYDYPIISKVEDIQQAIDKYDDYINILLESEYFRNSDKYRESQLQLLKQL